MTEKLKNIINEARFVPVKPIWLLRDTLQIKVFALLTYYFLGGTKNEWKNCSSRCNSNNCA